MILCFSRELVVGLWDVAVGDGCGGVDVVGLCWIRVNVIVDFVCIRIVVVIGLYVIEIGEFIIGYCSLIIFICSIVGLFLFSNRLVIDELIIK